jgi:hypothetical protein
VCIACFIVRCIIILAIVFVFGLFLQKDELPFNETVEFERVEGAASTINEATNAIPRSDA